MKTAISLPDSLYDEVEELARRMKTSRSQLYRAALEEYVARHHPDEIRDSIDRMVDDVANEDDGLAAASARSILESTDW